MSRQCRAWLFGECCPVRTGAKAAEGTEQEHGIYWHADIWICPGSSGHLWGHGGHCAAQLEGERRRGVQYHHSHLSDAGTVDGLYVVQHRDVQLYSQVLRTVLTCILADCPHYHGAVLCFSCYGSLSGLSRTQVHTLGRRTPLQATRCNSQWWVLCCCGIFVSSARFLVYERGHNQLPGLQCAREQ